MVSGCRPGMATDTLYPHHFGGFGGSDEARTRVPQRGERPRSSSYKRGGCQPCFTNKRDKRANKRRPPIPAAVFTAPGAVQRPARADSRPGRAGYSIIPVIGAKAMSAVNLTVASQPVGRVARPTVRPGVAPHPGP
jgi:hypothetical protein